MNTSKAGMKTRKKTTLVQNDSEKDNKTILCLLHIYTDVG